jgi:hypothetical protein
MDSDWVFNVECNQPPTNTSTYFDENIIPEVFYNAVINRNKQQMYTVIKNNPKLSKAIISFFQLTLANAFNFKKSAKFGAPVRIHWKLKDSKVIIMNFNDQVEFYRFLVVRPWNITNFGYLFQTIREYLSELGYGLYLVQQKSCKTTYYYRLGINVTNDQELKVFSMKFL